ncbi:MAG: FHA domain-containing protein, partial [Lachnospiraceae bacterium]|nr:FHA domain-containing protein [Lachnospiraceae bacterium]
LVSDDQPAINVTHFPFFVGKDAQHCDYVMTTQVGISRYHMKIDREGDDFTISDLNSTNGTFINGERLAPHLPHRIRRGDELRIGKCIYYCN